ncbi:MAG TPA: hypothetical protein DCM05_08155 [Elusimicrobia bacterium]|nr:hypothetical protein [Elusimicrobiota bacterium]
MRPWALLLGAAGLLYLAASNAVPFGQYVDDVQWLLYAENLLKGSGLKAWALLPVRELSLTWGVPAVLMPLLALFGRSLLLIKGTFAAAFFGGLLLFFLATRRGFEGPRLYAYLVLLFFCDFLLPFAGSALSEPPYLLLFGALVYLLAERDILLSERPKTWALLGALGAALALTRALGTAMLLAVLAELCLARRWRAAVVFTVSAAVCSTPYLLYAAQGEGRVNFYGIYWESLSSAGALGVFAGNAWFYLKGLSCLSFLYLPALAPSSAWVKVPFVMLCLALVGAGVFRGRRDPFRRVLALYLLAYLGVCCAYPYQAPRYVVPLYPVFLLFLCEGLLALPSRSAAGALCVLAVLGLGSNLPGLSRTLKASLSQPPEVPHAAYDWLRANSGEGDSVISTDAARIFYFTGRKGLLTATGEDAAAFAAETRRLKARFVVVGGGGFVPAAPGLSDPTRALHKRNARFAGDPRHFRLAHEDAAEGVRVYEPASRSLGP